MRASTEPARNRLSMSDHLLDVAIPDVEQEFEHVAVVAALGLADRFEAFRVPLRGRPIRP